MKQGLILAAGRGSRMREMTSERPKCLLELAGKALLDWQIAAFRQAGIERIFIVGGYRWETLFKHTGYETFINVEWERTNMVETLLCAQEILGISETIISYADIVYHGEIVSKLMNNPADISITYDLLWEDLWKERFSDPLKDAETFRVDQGQLREIGKTPLEISEIEGQYMGLLKFNPEGWERIFEILKKLPLENRKKMDMTTLLQHLIEREIPIEGVPVLGKWCEVDQPEDLLLYRAKLSEGGGWSHDWRS